jgi:hypothetical protein
MKIASLALVVAIVAFAAAEAPKPRVVVLDDGTLLEGDVESFDKLVRVTPAKGSARIVTTGQVAFVGESKSAAYDYISGAIDGKTAIGARQLATWCEKVGLPDKALIHAKTLAGLAPNDTGVREWIARLEKQTTTKPVADRPKPASAAVPPASIELASGAAVAFANRIQPILSNQCASCHAAKDYTGPFKLNRTTEGYANPEIAAANLKIVSAQLRAENPTDSPILKYALAAHGGLKRPSFLNRDAAAYRHLETWVLESLPKVNAPTGFAKPQPRFESSPEPKREPAEAPPMLPGAVVGELGRPAPGPVPPTVPPAPAASPAPPGNARDPFDPASFNRLPKKPAK